MELILVFILGFSGGLALWLWQRGRWLAQSATLHAEAAALQSQLEARRLAEADLTQAFKALAADALAANNQSFLHLAEQKLGHKEQAVAALVRPLQDSLDKISTQHQSLEKDRSAAYAGLTEQVKAMQEAQQSLRAETVRLVAALRRPEGRGRWGEVQLRRVVELAGMQSHCDFYEQEGTEGGAKRPDMVVRLPGGKTLVVDSKAPLSALLDVAEAADEKHATLHLQRFSQHVKDHIKSLSDKAYWAQFTDAPEFVVLFLPGESFFSTALQYDPELIEFAAERQVILATPTTLLALLKAVYYGWRQEALAENAQRISQLGAELYQRLATLGGHWNGVGKHLGQAVKAYNEATASLESRVMVSARRFGEMQVAAGELAVPMQVEPSPRTLQAVELRDSPTATAPNTVAPNTTAPEASPGS